MRLFQKLLHAINVVGFQDLPNFWHFDVVLDFSLNKVVWDKFSAIQVDEACLRGR